MKKLSLVLLLSLFASLVVSVSSVNARDLVEVIEDIATEIKEKKSEKLSNKKIEYKDEDYEIITYTDIMRKREGMDDVKHTFYAKVSQYEEVKDVDLAIAHVTRDGDPDRRYLLIFATLPENRLVENDVIDVYGTLHGLNDYETVMGATKTIPVLLVDKVLVQGVDY